MTTEQTEPKPLLDPLLASILTANVKWSNDLSDRVLENAERDAREWKERFLKLFRAIENANIKTDSLRIEQTLNHFAFYADTAARDSDTQ